MSHMNQRTTANDHEGPALRRGGRDEGWLETEVQEPDESAPIRFVVMKRGATQRTMMMQVMSGAMVMLSEELAEGAATA